MKQVIFPVKGVVAPRERYEAFTPCLVLFTGLPSSGKTSTAFLVEKALIDRGIASYVLDGDNLRTGLCSDLGFSSADRCENLRRAGEVARLMVDAGLVVLASFVSPYEEDRNMLRRLFKKNRFYEVYIKCPVEVCEKRDPKGLYRRARKGEIKNYTGIDGPYEEPNAPDLVVPTDQISIKEGMHEVLKMLGLMNDD